MDIIELAKRLWNAQAYALHRLCESVGEGPFRDMAEALASAVRKGGRILVTGQGESGIAARKFVQNLCAVDVPAVFFHPGDSVRISGGLIQPGDVMVLISKGGATESVLRWMNVAQKRGIPFMCVTQNSASPLALGCDGMLRANPDKHCDDENPMAMTSTMVMIGAMDALALGVLALLHEGS